MKLKRFGLHLNMIRRSLGLSENEVAEKAGYKNGAIITAIENGTKSVEDSKIKDIANALGVSISQLVGYRRIEISEKGWPRLTESEKTALFLFAPVIEVLDKEDFDRLIDYALLLCRRAEGKRPAWKEPEYKSKKEDRKNPGRNDSEAEA